MLRDAERLQLQQLRLLEASERQPEVEEAEVSIEGDRRAPRSLPSHWSLIGDLTLHPWQESARRAWFDAGCRGTIKVVTGAGKTVLALAVAEELQRRDPELRVAIVVPTIVLMDQWYRSIIERSNLPDHAVARLGGGHAGSLDGDRRILIAVLASARKELPALVQREGVGDHLLLVVDESHRAGAPEMSRVLQTDRAYSLGLSATPERGEGEFGEDENAALMGQLGGIAFELTFDDAIRAGILPPFEIHHYGLSLRPSESQRYTALTRSLSDARRELAAISPAARRAIGGDGFLRWVRRAASRGGDLSAIAARYANDTARRKQLLYRAESRSDAALALVHEALDSRRDARVILFHESIEEVAELFERMMRAGVPAVMEHSELPPELRERSLELFREGLAQVIVSARSLIEGFDVPAADLGIVVASSTSPRQRIQSIGRVLRRYSPASGEEKSPRVCVLYVRGTVDEAIYEKQDWGRLVGLDRNRYFHWDPPREPIEQASPPRTAIPQEDEIDVSALAPGDVYPGRYLGAEYSVDARGNVSGEEGRIALNPQGVPAAVIAARGQPGRFRVTPNSGAILVRTRATDDDWVTVFAGLLREPLAFPEEDDRQHVDVHGLAPGDTYTGPLAPATEYRFRQRAGGVIARKVRGGEVFARGPDAERLVEILRRLSRAGPPISRFYVNSLDHAFWREKGEGRYIAALDGPLEFPEAPT